VTLAALDYGGVEVVDRHGRLPGARMCACGDVGDPTPGAECAGPWDRGAEAPKLGVPGEQGSPGAGSREQGS
jgi:hypothetical protein